MTEAQAISNAKIAQAADDAARMLKTLSNPARLRLLCALVERDCSVSELEEIVQESQSYVSGQLAKLRAEGLVENERNGRQILYRLSDDRLIPVLHCLYEVFCSDAAMRQGDDG